MSFFISLIKFKSIKIIVVSEMPASAYAGQGQTVMLLSPEGDAFRNGQFFAFFLFRPRCPIRNHRCSFKLSFMDV